MTEQEDHLYLESANHGDMAGFESLYHKYKDWVYALAWRFTLNHDDASDVVQETFIYVLGKIPGLKLTANFKTFLYPVVKHNSIAAAARRRRFVSQLGPEDLENCQAYSPDTDNELKEALGFLEEPDREILILRFVDDLSIEEIAQATGQKAGAVKSRLYRCLEQLRSDARLKKYFEK